jgi:polysaccharide deacetylase family protein (PEP-CTERM system associated)
MNGPPDGRVRNALSVDVEDLEASVREPLGLPPSPSSDYLARHTVQLLELLGEYGARATFFVNAQSVEKHPRLLSRIVEQGHELAAHGYSHRFLSAYRSPAAFREDLERCLALLDRECGVRPDGYRAPGFTLRGCEDIVLPVLRELGFKYSSSVLPVAHTLQHGYRRGPTRPFRWPNGVVELPLSSWEFLGRRWPAFGSWSLRLLPLANTTAAIGRLNALGRPAYLYLHAWEVFGQPVSREVAYARFPAQRIWLAGRGPLMERRLRRLLARYRFTTYGDLVDWNAPVEPPVFS